MTSNFLTDALGSPIAVTDTAGTVQTEYTYETFGKTTVTGASNTNPYQYTGRENDGTGLYYYRARYYSPGLQRFISEDPMEFFGGTLNLYVYVGNEPIGYADPFGLQKGRPLIRPNPLQQGMERGADALDWIDEGRQNKQEFNDWVDWENEKRKKLAELERKFECDTWVLVCWPINRTSKGRVFVVFGMSKMIPGGYDCELRLVPGRNRNCCSANPP